MVVTPSAIAREAVRSMKQLTRGRSGNWDNRSDRRRSVRTIDETELNRLTPLESFSPLISLFETHRVSRPAAIRSSRTGAARNFKHGLVNP